MGYSELCDIFTIFFGQYLPKQAPSKTHHYYNDVQYVPDTFEVRALVYSQLKNLLYNIIEDEQAEDTLAAQYEVIPVGDIADQFHCPYLVGRNSATRSWEFNQQPAKTNQPFLSKLSLYEEYFS